MAIFGPRTTPCAWLSRPVVTGSWWAGAVRGARGCSLTSPPPSRAPMCACARGSPGARSELRNPLAWYLKGYPVGSELRRQFALVESLENLDELTAHLDLDAAYPGATVEGKRGRAGTPKIPALPDGWLTSRELEPERKATLLEAELGISGG